MKGTRAISFLLVFALMASLVVPGFFAQPAKADGTDNGMRISKTATKNDDDGSYTITLEAYATGSQVISEVKTDIPTDIVLVLDQSGSMKDKMNTYSFRKYTNNTNSGYYELRHNGGKENLYYQLDDGGYAAVSVVKSANLSDSNFTKLPENTTNYNYYSTYRKILFVKVGDQYQPVTVSRSGIIDRDYTYTFPDGTTYSSSGHYGSPKDFKGKGPLYYLNNTSSVEYSYTYSYTDNDGVRQTIGTLTGENAVPGFTLYERYVSDTPSRLVALQSAVTGFADSVAKKAKGADGVLGTEDDVNHRIAVVGFATGNYTSNSDYPAYENTELFIGSTQYNYNVNASQHYASAFQDMSTEAGYNNVIASKNALAARGATYPNYGLAMASGIFNAYPIPENEKRNRVVVLFTDGAPGYSSFDSDVANSAITSAATLKNNSVTIYSVGIFEGANATSAGSSTGDSPDPENWFMQRVSSNNGTPQTPSYYLSAADAGTLNNIFQQISDQIESGGTTATLGSSSVVKDIIAPSFQLPAGATADSITLETYSYTGENTWNKNTDAMGATATIIDGQVSVTGFNFSENWCGTVTENGNTTYRGNKLKISFKVVPKEGFLGGNDVPTNGTASGVYTDEKADSPIMAFDVPTVNVPIATPEFEVNNKTIYEGNSTAVSGLYTLPDYTGDNAWKAAYVNVTTTGTTAGETVSPTVCTDYTVTVTYAPLTDGSKSVASGGGAANAMAGESASETATVHVLHPVVTAAVNDVEKYYGESYTLGDGAGGSITLNWVDEVTTHTDIPDAEGTAPYTKDALHLEYATTQFAGQSGTVPKNNFDVTVTVKKGSEVVTGATITTTCGISGSNCKTPDTDGKYTVHVKTCQLTIEKTGGAAGEPYVFDVYKNGTKYSEVSIVGNSTATIVELPVGEYSIVEDQGWSWRYPNPSYGSNVTLSATDPNGTITCTNTKTGNFWLNGFSAVVKNIFGIAG